MIAVKVLTRLLILLLVPWVILYSSGSAQAASTYSDPVSVDIHMSDFRPGYDVDCNVMGYYGLGDDNTQTVHLGLRCSWGWMLSDPVENIHLEGTVTAAGSGCTPSASFSSMSEGVRYSAAPSVDVGCHITEVCVSMKRVMVWMEDITWNGCAPLDLGVPDTFAPGGTCDFATVSPPTVGSPYVHGPTSGYYHTDRDVTAFIASSNESTINWTKYVLWRMPDGATLATGPGWVHANAAHTSTVSGATKSYLSNFATNGVAPGTTGGGVVVAQTRSRTTSNPPAPLENAVVVGAGYVISSSLSGATWNNLPQAHVTGVYGVTNPSICAFYWGEKVADVPADTTDEPLGPLGSAGFVPEDPPTDDPAPVETGSSCNFSWSDPGSWASAGICALVALMGRALDLLGSVLGLLGDVVQFLGGLVTSLVDALGDLLSALFVPSDGKLNDTLDSVRHADDGTNVEDWRDAFDAGWNGQGSSSPTAARALATGGGGCMGPALEWDKLAMVDLPTTIYPIEACEGTSADMAYWSHLLLTIMVSIGGGVKILEMTMVAVGAQKQTGILLGHDWSSASVRRD